MSKPQKQKDSVALELLPSHVGKTDKLINKSISHAHKLQERDFIERVLSNNTRDLATLIQDQGNSIKMINQTLAANTKQVIDSAKLGNETVTKLVEVKNNIEDELSDAKKKFGQLQDELIKLNLKIEERTRKSNNLVLVVSLINAFFLISILIYTFVIR